MPKPPETKPLIELVRDSISKLPGFVDLDAAMPTTEKRSRGDYMAYDGRLIIEQKEFSNSPQHISKGRAIESFCSSMTEKYGNAINEVPGLAAQRMTVRELATYNKLTDNFYDRIKDAIYAANKQICSTKQILQQSDSTGMVVLVSDEVLGIIPEVVRQRVRRCFNTKTKDGFSPFEHIDVVVTFARVKHMSICGGNGFNMCSPRTQAHDFAKTCGEELLGFYRLKVVVNRPLQTISTDRPIIIEQRRASVFDPPE